MRDRQRRRCREFTPRASSGDGPSWSSARRTWRPRRRASTPRTRRATTATRSSATRNSQRPGPQRANRHGRAATTPAGPQRPTGVACILPVRFQGDPNRASRVPAATPSTHGDTHREKGVILLFDKSRMTRMALTEAHVVAGHIVRCHRGTVLRSL